MPEGRRTPVLVIILAGYLMIVLDISIVITACWPDRRVSEVDRLLSAPYCC